MRLQAALLIGSGAIVGVVSWLLGFRAGIQQEQERFRRYTEQRLRAERTR